MGICSVGSSLVGIICQSVSEFSTMKKPTRRLQLMWTLQQVAKKLHKKDLRWWVKNCGRFVSTKLGPVIWLRKHGVVQKMRRRKQVPMQKAAKGKKKPPQSRGWEKLDFDKAGGDGAYLLVGMDDRHMNAKVEELLQDADIAQKTRHASGAFV